MANLPGALVVVLQDGTEFRPTTIVKNQAQQNILGVAIGSTIPIIVPTNAPDIMDNLMAQAGKLNVTDLIAFRNMWRNTPDNPNNFKLTLQPASHYDQFGNFAYGATAQTVGFSLGFTQWAGALGRNGSFTGNNLPVNKQDIASGYNAALAGASYYIAPVHF